MSAKRTAMRKLREVLRLSFSAGLAIRQISASTKISVGSIRNILKLAEQLKLSWPLPEEWDDQTLALKFYPRSDARPSAKYQDPVWLKSMGVMNYLFLRKSLWMWSMLRSNHFGLILRYCGLLF